MSGYVLRVAASTDADFLRALHADAHALELALLPEAVANQITDLQVRAQALQYSRSWPSAQDHVVLVDGRPAARVWLDRGAHAHRVLDLAVLTPYRRAGLATALLRRLQDEAGQAGVPLCLAVWHANATAAALYASLGFRQVAEAGGHLELTWLADVPAGAV